MVMAADSNKDGKIDKEELQKLLSDPDIFEQASATVEEKAKADAANEAYFATTQKNMQPGAMPWSRSLYDHVATRASFLSSKVGQETYAVSTLADMLNRGDYKLGSGGTLEDLVKLGFDPKNLVLGGGAVIHDIDLGTPLLFSLHFLFSAAATNAGWTSTPTTAA